MRDLLLLRRLITFYRRHGFRSTLTRGYISLRRLSYCGKMILFSCRLPIKRSNTNKDIQFERVCEENISKQDYKCILNTWDSSIRARQFVERFGAGCELWLAKIDGRIAGFGWSIQGRTIEPYFFPLKSCDVHLFDFFVLPEYRGRGVNVDLVMKILETLSERKEIRFVYIECAAWNEAQIRSLSKTAFRKYAAATKAYILGWLVILWHES